MMDCRLQRSLSSLVVGLALIFAVGCGSDSSNETVKPVELDQQPTSELPMEPEPIVPESKP